MELQEHWLELTRDPAEHAVVFDVTNLTPGPADPVQLLALNRHRWGIENTLRYVRDVTFDEDRCPV